MKYRVWDGEDMILLENAGLQYFDFEGSYALSFVVDGYTDFWAHEQYGSATKEAQKHEIMEYTKADDRDGENIFDLDIVELMTTVSHISKGNKAVVYYCPIHNRFAAVLIEDYGAVNTGFRPHFFITPANAKKIKVVSNLFKEGISKTKNRSYS